MDDRSTSSSSHVASAFVCFVLLTSSLVAPQPLTFAKRWFCLQKVASSQAVHLHKLNHAHNHRAGHVLTAIVAVGSMPSKRIKDFWAVTGARVRMSSGSEATSIDTKLVGASWQHKNSASFGGT